MRTILLEGLDLKFFEPQHHYEYIFWKTSIYKMLYKTRKAKGKITEINECMLVFTDNAL